MADDHRQYQANYRKRKAAEPGGVEELAIADALKHKKHQGKRAKILRDDPKAKKAQQAQSRQQEEIRKAKGGKQKEKESFEV
jgi:hypothetical protein